jgi:hypothetical protein
VPVERGSSGKWLKIAGYATAGLGIASGTFAIVSAVKAGDEANIVAHSPRGTIWDTVASHQHAGQEAQTRARVSGAIGIAAAVGGGVLWWLGHSRESARVDVAIVPGATEMSFSCVF